ncbi:hypothetical protein I4U23_004424 [Adineta vaga]|nr:hypothetical protein I4U23_004424 [Adineta vaga]
MGASNSNPAPKRQSHPIQHRSKPEIRPRQMTTRIPEPRHVTTTVRRPLQTRIHTERPYRMYYNPRSGIGYVGPRLPHLIEPSVRVYY